MLISENEACADTPPAVEAGTSICSCCGRELKSLRQRIRNDDEAYCTACYRRLMFPDMAEAGMEHLD